MKNKILKLLKNVDHQPFLFVGSGLSMRYIGLQSWEGLLRYFAGIASSNPFAYEQYVQQAKALECKEGLLPKVAELIERDFNRIWFEDSRFEESRVRSTDLIRRSVSPFKIEIAHYMEDKSHSINEEYATEIEMLKKLEMKSISGILTTNYDTFLEGVFSAYTRFVGQEELIFSTLQGVSEIYKIHGCCTKPESIVINESDYIDFSERNAYLAAKILTIFLEHPVIFIGYSISDRNVENILKAIVKCLSPENLLRLKERLVFIERAHAEEPEEMSTYSKSFEGGKSIEMTRIKLNSFEPLYQALLENQAKYNAPMLRKLKQDIYELVLTSKPTGRIRTVNLEDEKLEEIEVVVGVGVLADFGQVGYAGITANELYLDIVYDDRDFDSESIVELSLPVLLSRNSNSLPMNKYICDYKKDIPEKVKNALKVEYDDLLSSSVKKNRDNSQHRNETIKSLRAKYILTKCLQVLPYLDNKNIEIDDLRGLLLDVVKERPNLLTGEDQNIKSDFKRAARIYDWLKYNNKQKEL